MNQVKIPLIIDDSVAELRPIIERALAHYGCLAHCELEFASQEQGSGVFGAPVRLGAVLDYVNRAIKSGGQDDILSFGGYVLDCAQGVLTNLAGAEVILTDKESELLQILYRAGGDLVERDVLLAQIWGYAPGVETHTVETHIYRLRQKIKSDGADFDLIVTEGAGYRLSI